MQVVYQRKESGESMKLYADCHTHTIYSHGKGTIEDNVKSAIDSGLKLIVISDHGPGHMFFGVSSQNLKKMKKEITELQKRYKEIEIRLGVEANIIGCDGTLDVISDDIKTVDMLLAGFHNGVRFKSFKDFLWLYVMNHLAKIFPPIREKCRIVNTKAVINAIEKYNINFITHPGAKVDIDTELLAKAAAKCGTALEINASHGFLNADYVKIAMKEKVNFIINSDAHRPCNVGNFTKGIETAKKAKLPADRILNAEDFKNGVDK